MARVQRFTGCSYLRSFCSKLKAKLKTRLQESKHSAWMCPSQHSLMSRERHESERARLVDNAIAFELAAVHLNGRKNRKQKQTRKKERKETSRRGLTTEHPSREMSSQAIKSHRYVVVGVLALITALALAGDRSLPDLRADLARVKRLWRAPWWPKHKTLYFCFLVVTSATRNGTTCLRFDSVEEEISASFLESEQKNQRERHLFVTIMRRFRHRF